MRLTSFTCVATLVLSAAMARAEIKTVVEHLGEGEAAAGFKFKNILPPMRSDAAAKRRNSRSSDGEQDRNGGDLDKLHDGLTPTDADQPGSNFFFKQGSDGGRIQIDLGGIIEMQRITTY